MLYTAALFLTLTTVVVGPAAQNPPEQDSGPVFTSDDIAPAEPARAAPSRSTPARTGSSRSTVFLTMLPTTPPPRVTQSDWSSLRASLEAGRTVSASFRFDLTPDGQPRNVQLVSGTGYASIDETIRTELTRTPMPTNGRGFSEMADCRDFRFQIDYSAAFLACDFSAEAPTVERALELEAQGRAQLSHTRKLMGSTPEFAAIFDGASVDRNGQRVMMRFGIDGGLLESLQKKGTTQTLNLPLFDR